jgi:hypothetical protein
MARDPYDIAIDKILEGADGDIRLALRTVLIQKPTTRSETAGSFRKNIRPERL